MFLHYAYKLWYVGYFSSLFETNVHTTFYCVIPPPKKTCTMYGLYLIDSNLHIYIQLTIF